jgi:hypothetical protein
MKSYIVIPIEKEEMFYSLAPKFGVKATWSHFFSRIPLTDEEYFLLINELPVDLPEPDMAEIEVEYENEMQLFLLGYAIAMEEKTKK